MKSIGDKVLSNSRPWVAVLLLAVLMGCAGSSWGQTKTPGVSDSTILIGSCSALDGPARFLGTNTVLGATAYLHIVNDKGGVHGRRVQWQAFDDGYDPDKTTACFQRLMREDVFAAGFFVGTPTAAKYVPMAEEHKLPVVGLFTGAQLLYSPLKHWVINVRASYYDETREMVDGLWNGQNVTKVGVIYQDDAFGKAVLDGVKLALDKHRATPAGLGTFTRNTLDVDAGIKAARAANPEAVVVVGPYAPVAEIVKRSHAQGWHPIFLTVSFVGTEAFIKEAGKDAEGTVITQVVPPYDRTDLPTIQLYNEALKKYYPGTEPSFVSLEGFVDAMVLVEGLKRAGKDVTREKLIESIESIHSMDMGLGPKLTVSYSATDHKGFKGVYATVVRGGKPVVFTDWKKMQ